MAKRRREPDSDGTTSENLEFNTLFVDTSVDTHLAMLISSSDTVSDFKKKMTLEHKHCFPAIGEMQIHSVKVKRRENFYHLPDFMLVWSAFRGVKGSWFLLIDASRTDSCHFINNSSELGTGDGVEMAVTNVGDNCRVSSEVDKRQILPTHLLHGAIKKNVVSGMIAGSKIENYVEKTTNFDINISSEGNCKGTESRPKKKRKVTPAEDECHSPRLKDGCTVFHASGKDTSIPEVVGCSNFTIDSVKEAPRAGILHEQEQHGKLTVSNATTKDSSLLNEQFDAEDGDMFEGASPSMHAEKCNLGSTFNSQKLLGSSERKVDHPLESKVDDELSQDVPTKHSEDVSVNVPDLSAGLMDNSGVVGDVNTDGNKSKRKKVQNTYAEIQDTTDMEQTGKGESMKPCTEIHKSEMKKENKVLSSDHDHEVIIPSNSKVSKHVDPDLAMKEASFLQGEDAVMEPEISSDMKKKKKNQKKKKKKREKKFADTNLEESGIEQTNNGIRCSSSLPLPSKPEMVGCENSPVDSVKESLGARILHEQHGEPNMSDATAEDSSIQNKKFGAEDGAAFEGTTPSMTAEKCSLASIWNSQKLLHSDERIEDNSLESKMDNEIAQDIPTKHSKNDSVKLPDLSAELMDGSGVMGDVNADGNKRKKKKTRKTDTDFLDATDMEQTGKGDSMKPRTEAHKSPKTEEEKLLSLDHDHKAVISPDSKVSDHIDPDLALKEESPLRHEDAVMKLEIPSGIDKNRKKKMKKKKRVNKSVDTNLEKPSIEQTDHGTSFNSSLPFPSTDDIPKETVKEKSIMHHEGKDIQMKLLESSTLDAREKVKGLKGNEVDIMILTQPEQSLEVVGTAIEKANKETSSAGNCHADSPTETANLIVESNQEGKDIENKENNDRKAAKKRKKRKLAESDVLENLHVEDHKGHIEAFANEETSNSYVNSEQERRHDESFLSSRSEEKPDKMHRIAENTNGHTNISEKEGEGINFKHYFVPGQYQDNVDSGGKAKNPTKSNKEMEKKVKDDDLPSVIISTELQNSVKSSEIKKSENKSRVRKATDRSKGDSAQNSIKSFEDEKTEDESRARKATGRSKVALSQKSDWDEESPNSLKKSLVAPGKGVKDSSTSEIHEMTFQKPNEIRAVSSCVNKKNPYLDKSSPEWSETFLRKQRNGRLQSGLNVTSTMLMKTPQKKSLLTKSGAIFQDNSGESSGGENGIVPSHRRPLSPSDSDSSSMSGCSVGESDLSQDSTRNGSKDVKGRSTERGNMSKLELPDKNETKDVMRMILRSSKRFEKAKLLASQNEAEQNDSQAVEFVPESQPT